jgi:hypothetical protein
LVLAGEFNDGYIATRAADNPPLGRAPLCAALRRSELAGLDYAQARDGDGYLQLTAEAVEIVLLRSKARTEPATVLVPRENNPGLVAVADDLNAVRTTSSTRG